MYWLTRRVLEVARTVPDIVWALLFIIAFGIGPLAGILAITVHTVGAQGKLFAEVNENISPLPIDGVRASGGSWLQVMPSPCCRRSCRITCPTSSGAWSSM